MKTAVTAISPFIGLAVGSCLQYKGDTTVLYKPGKLYKIVTYYGPDDNPIGITIESEKDPVHFIMDEVAANFNVFPPSSETDIKDLKVGLEPEPSISIAEKEDRISHPSHYTWLKDKCGIEVIDITRHLDFDRGNALKYILRATHKSEQGMSDKEKAIEDINKAIFYLNDYKKNFLENA